MLGLPILYLKGMRLMMFQLSGFCCIIYSEFQKVWKIDLGGFMLGLPILYLKGMRLMRFQLSGFCCIIYSEFPKVGR